MVSDKFMFFENFKSTADKLPDDMRLKFYDALTDYVFKGLEPEDPVISALVNAFKPSLDKVERRGGNNNPHGQNQHFEVKVGQNRSKVIEGCQQEELSGQNEGKKGQEGRSFLETETETETEVKNNLTVIKKEKSIKKFQKPTITSPVCLAENSRQIKSIQSIVFAWLMAVFLSNAIKINRAKKGFTLTVLLKDPII